MAEKFIEILKREFDLNEMDINLLQKVIRNINGDDRRYYFRNLKPREKNFEKTLQSIYDSLEPDSKKRWLDTVVKSMLERGGEPDITDSIVMRIIGPVSVYNHMRLKAEKEGILLKALTGLGGMGALLVLVVAITAVLLFFIADK
ncbi:MAG: hypothetical protein M1130_01885 [Actinobacteria bacterium]|nr:hypothetical protein [Actinomycetota bacterium]